MLAGILCAGLAATWAVGEVLDKHEKVLRDEQEVARMTEKMKTQCVGRLLIDMPAEAQVALGQVRIDGFQVTAFKESLDEFEARIAEREAQLSAKPDRLGGNKNLESARDVRNDAGISGRIFVHSLTVTEGTRAKGLALERYRYEGVSVEALVHGHGVSIDLSSDDRDPAWIKDLPVLVHKLVANPDNALPTEPGFCIDHAYFRDPITADQGEEIMMFARLPNHPDIDFMLILAAGVKPDEQGLLARSEAAEGRLSLAEKMRITKLRAAPRVISGLSGEELVELFVEENEARVHSFWWEVNGTEDDIFLPHIVFKMNTGNGRDKPVPSSLSEGAALGLWDKITSTIRLRQAIPKLATLTEAPAAPIGAYASAGEPCPQTGWWLCGDGGNGVGVLGGERQYIKKGELMPQALLLPPQTLWDKVRGLQPSFESKNPTAWKLVDKRARKRLPPAMALAAPLAPASTSVVGTGRGVMEQQRVPVGSFAVTGFPCPASGWWRCEQSHALDGTRWFAQGAVLPPATFAVPPGVFGRSVNTPKSIQRRGEWRLMRLADAPGQPVGNSAIPVPDQSAPLQRDA